MGDEYLTPLESGHKQSFGPSWQSHNHLLLNTMVEYRSLYKLSVFVFVSLVVMLSISTVAAKEQFIADYTKQMEDEGTQERNVRFYGGARYGRGGAGRLQSKLVIRSPD